MPQNAPVDSGEHSNLCFMSMLSLVLLFPKLGVYMVGDEDFALGPFIYQYWGLRFHTFARFGLGIWLSDLW